MPSIRRVDMRAASYNAKGAARDVLRVGLLERPEPGPGEVRVRIRASGVNPSDVKARSGLHVAAMPFPIVIPHSDGAGDIDAVGEGVPESRLGERVWLWNAQYKRPSGTAAEYVVLPARQAVTLPNGTSYAEGACLGIPAFTAVHALNLAGVEEGATLLVAGGAGAVSQYAIQIARRRGVRVVASVSSEEKSRRARDAGAEAAFNYRSEDFGAQVRDFTEGAGVDAIVELDLAANAHLIPAVLRPGGTVVTYGLTGVEVTIPARWMLQNSASLRFFLVYELTEAQRAMATGQISELLESGELQHPISRIFSLDEIVKAHQMVESGAGFGNVVVEI